MRDLVVPGADFGALAAAILGTGGGLRFRARGGSMSPFIRHGDLLEVRPVDFSALRRGKRIELNGGLWRLMGVLWMGLWPFSVWSYRALKEIFT
jgi:hypothetical protein